MLYFYNSANNAYHYSSYKALSTNTNLFSETVTFSTADQIQFILLTQELLLKIQL